MPVFPSSEWLDAYVDAINTSADFAEAAKTFRADLSYVFEADPDYGHETDVWARAGVKDGVCEWWHYDVPPEEGAKAEFILRAPYSMWREIILGEVDPMEAMLDGDLAVTGHLPTLLRYVRAANELVTLAAAVSTNFEGEPLAEPTAGAASATG
ncbi:MAG: SCP2 sterol-binding domain-containing protein [Actinocatenispora sp.]